jgi:hypothetical protein
MAYKTRTWGILPARAMLDRTGRSPEKVIAAIMAKMAIASFQRKE